MEPLCLFRLSASRGGLPTAPLGTTPGGREILCSIKEEHVPDTTTHVATAASGASLSEAEGSRQSASEAEPPQRTRSASVRRCPIFADLPSSLRPRWDPTQRPKASIVSEASRKIPTSHKQREKWGTRRANDLSNPNRSHLPGIKVNLVNIRSQSWLASRN